MVDQSDAFLADSQDDPDAVHSMLTHHTEAITDQELRAYYADHRTTFGERSFEASQESVRKIIALQRTLADVRGETVRVEPWSN